MHFYRISDKKFERGIRYTLAEAGDYHTLTVNGHEIFYDSPYALFYFDGQQQRMMLSGEIRDMPKDDMLTDVLKAGILNGDYHCFEYGSVYLLKYAPDFIKPYIERFAKGAFTNQERSDMGEIRPEYVQELARKLEAAQKP